jgi:hypothetical protein
MVGLSFWNAFGTAEPQKALDPRKAMIDVLPALGPHSSLGDEARVFDGETRVRWSFNDIRKDSFLWRGEISADAGKTWQLEQEMRVKRRNPIS